MLVVRDVPNHYHNGDGRARRRAGRVLPARKGGAAQSADPQFANSGSAESFVRAYSTRLGIFGGGEVW